MNDAAMTPPLAQIADHAQFVTWLRQVAPYVHAHRGRTFVVAFSGSLIASGQLTALVQDVSLLSAMGIRIVLVHGSRPQVQAQLALRGVDSLFHNDVRITDAAALECAKEAAGEIRLDIEAAFSQGLPSTPMAHSKVRVVSGNFVTARPMGIIDGVDLQLTGVVRKVDTDALRFVLANGGLVLLSPLGFSPTGEAFNLTMEDVACSVATALKADKLVLLTETPGIAGPDGALLSEISMEDAEGMLTAGQVTGDAAFNLRYAVKACRGGVARAHILPYALDGGILVELFTHDGVGTMVAPENLEKMRDATADDVGGIIKLIEPLEADGTLVKRPRELIEREIDRFTVLEHDGYLFGCAALYPFPQDHAAELACLTVHPQYQGYGDGERLMKRIEAKAKATGIERLFVLTTRTAHFFIKRGFKPAGVDDLPPARQYMYNWQRRSQVLIKSL
ncbi:MAG TPA: amino-acid N-acetyltransferase [Burkholderiaceae bacterium]|nr:amino-acid N-acetyltransferase [Burkholderiaceae bacterium]